MKFEPIFAYCKIEREKLKSKSGLILLPDGADKRNAKGFGILVAAGDTASDVIKTLVGKRVLFKEFAGSWVEIEGEQTFVCHEEDILGVVQD